MALVATPVLLPRILPALRVVLISITQSDDFDVLGISIETSSLTQDVMNKEHIITPFITIFFMVLFFIYYSVANDVRKTELSSA